MGCPIRTPRDQSLLAAPPGFSQRATSFIASWRQGIHQMPFSYSNQNPPCTGTIHATYTHASQHTQGRIKAPNPTASHTHHSAHIMTSLNTAATPAISHAVLRQHTLGQTPMPAQPRTPTHNPEPTHTKGARGQSHPRCPARPETHQNLIHNQQRTQRTPRPGTG